MELQAQTYNCPSCGMPLKEGSVDFNTRRAHCDWCGSDVVLARKTINSSGKVMADVANAVKFFLDKNFELAKKCADSVLLTAVDNAAALFVSAYYEAFVAATKTRDALERFFGDTVKNLDFDAEEEEYLKKLVLASSHHLADYEYDLLYAFSRFDGEKALSEFVEKFSPYIIIKRRDMNWLNGDMKRVYEKIAEKADVPKTWYALFVSASENPDSPYAENSFYLKTKTARFYNEYFLSIGDIFAKIKNPTLKSKFIGAFEKKKEDFLSKMG